MTPVAANNEETPNDRDPYARRRLAVYIENRRIERTLSVRAAAELAGVARNTWTGIEDASRKTADSNYAGIERALLWAPGSILRILNGEEPILIKPAADPASERDEAIARVMTSAISDAKKKEIVELLIAEREAAEQQRLERAELLIRYAGDDA